jgi:hypothetical protein
MLSGDYDSARTSNTGSYFQPDIGFNDAPAGVGEVYYLKGLYTFPNPGNGLFTVGFEPHRWTETALLTVADMTGKIVWSRSLTPVQADLYTTNVDLGNMPKGVYALCVVTGNERQMRRIIVE